LSGPDFFAGDEFVFVAEPDARRSPGHDELRVVIYVREGGDVVLHASSTSPMVNNTTDLDFVLYASPGTYGGTPTPRTVSAGSYRDFVLKGNATGVTTNASVTTYLRGDSDAPKLSATFMTTAALVDAWYPSANNNFVWSDFSAPSHSRLTTDWTNGYLVSGLPSSGMTSQTISFP